MMWIEVLARDGTVTQRQRVDAPEARIGRAFDNDVIVDDPHVAPHHVRVRRGEDGALVAEDLGSVNGLYAEQGVRAVGSLVLAGSPGIRIGRTTLRVHDATQPVAPEKPLTPQRTHARWAALATAALFALVALLNWLQLTTEPTAGTTLLPLAALAIVLLLWAGFWAATSRSFHGQAQFALQLRIAASACIALVLWDQVAETAAFALAWRAVTEHAALGVWAILVLACFAHLRTIAARHLRAIMAGIAALAVAGIAVQYLGRSEARDLLGERATLGDLRPPALRLAPLVTTSEFLRRAEATKQRVDRARLEEPPPGGALSDMDPTE